MSKTSFNLFVLIEADQNLPLANVRDSPMVAIVFDYYTKLQFFFQLYLDAYICAKRKYSNTVYLFVMAKLNSRSVEHLIENGRDWINVCFHSLETNLKVHLQNNFHQSYVFLLAAWLVDLFLNYAFVLVCPNEFQYQASQFACAHRV